MRRGNQYQFSQVPQAEIQRSVFNRPHSHKTSIGAGKLIPLMVDEVLPGDSWKVNLHLFARMFVPIAPLMDNIYIDVHFFFVPNRLVWQNWQKFCGEQANPGDSTSYVVPRVNITPAVGNLADYMGLPVGAAQSVNALPFRGYNRIWNEWYRDENLQNQVSMVTGDGPDSGLSYVVLPRAKRHDYFTSCLPFPQKGTGVNLPLGSQAVVKTSATETLTGAQAGVKLRQAGGGVPSADDLLGTGATGAQLSDYSAVQANRQGDVYFSNLYADLGTATGPTINSLRQAFQIQRLMERDARGGTRYVELLKSHFGVTSPDFRLQRPEFLGGGTIPVIINPVVQQSGTANGTTPQGTLTGMGVAAGKGVGFTKSFVEHGYVFCLISARADLTYYQGVNRMWRRSTRYDYYWPSLAHLGEQSVLQGEIFSDGSANDSNVVFGYQERWAEYKYAPSKVTGLMRPGVTGSLQMWHLAQTFAQAPLLNDTFIQENPPLQRVKADASAADFIVDSLFQVQCARPMPMYSVPGMTDHF